MAPRLHSFEAKLLALAVSVLCLALNAFFVAAEFALVKVHVTQLEPRVRKGDRRAKTALLVLHRLDRYLSVTQFGITVASLGLGWLGEPALAALADTAAVRLTGSSIGTTGRVIVSVVALGILTFLHLLLGELVPKFVAIQHSEETVLRTVRFLRLVDTVFRPVLWVLELSQRAVLRLFGIDPERASEGTLSEDQIVGILAAATARTVRGVEKQRMVERVLRFARRPVRQIMVSRVDVFALDVDTPVPEALERVKKEGFSRVLLIENQAMDDVAGYLYVKDLFVAPGARDRDTLRGLGRHALFVPESRDALSVLRDMQEQRTPFAVVVDEYGGTSGIVTMEDLVEDVLGDIRDELDVEPEIVVLRATDPPTWEVDAGATVDDLRDNGVPVDRFDRLEAQESGEHIGKLVLDRLGHLPSVGDVVELGEGALAEIVATTRRRVHRVRIRVERAPPSSPEPRAGRKLANVEKL
ncbi:MAG: HlyC/CorC family transporter [Labilithrix sp.]|nr:HlyC/CorC family transporter [Labilithrix sp.]